MDEPQIEETSLLTSNEKSEDGDDVDDIECCTNENDIIDQVLTKSNQVRLPVPGDGHCIVRAFFKAFSHEVDCEISSYTELLQDACAEIMSNLSFYEDKISSNTDIAQELYKYQIEKVYNQDIVDLIIYALANCTKSTVVVMYSQGDSVKRFEIPPAREGVSQRTVTLARTGEHYEAVVTMETSREETTRISKSPEIPVIVISDSNNTPKKTQQKERDAIPMSCAEIYSVIVDSDSEPLPKKPKVKAELGDDSDNSSSLNDSSSDYDTSHPISRNNPIKLTPEVWSEIPVLKCNALPGDINGNVVYELPFDPKRRMASSNDGRRWKRYMSSNRSGFNGIRRLARCAGSFKCTNSLCNFRKQWGPNLTHFDKVRTCKFCGNSADFVTCLASKVWEFNDHRQSVRVYHHGLHTCPVVVKSDATEASDALKKRFVADSEMKPRKAVTAIITDAIKEGRAWADIDTLTESLIDPSLPKNVKQKVRKELHPEGHSFEAVKLLQTKL